MADSFVQLLPNSTGSQVDMGSVQTNAGSLILRQRAELQGDSADMLFQILTVLKSIQACQRAMLANFNTGNPTSNFEDDYLNVD